MATKLNFIDRAIGYVAPAAAARRARNRAVLDILTRDYAGASKGRLQGGWRSSPTSADTEVAVAGAFLRDRMRDLVRNNPHAANAVSALVTYIVGEGIMPRANTGDPKKDKKVNDLFDKWAKKADADGQLDFYGLQTLAIREMIESGDGLVRRRRRLLTDNLPVPLQLEVFETDRIDSAKEGPMPAGRVAVQGIEFDKLGARTAYWLFPAHPGNRFLDPRSTSLTSKAVPASDIAHVYEKQRTQVKGVPWGTPSLTYIKDLGSYEEAEIVRKKIESCVVGILVNKTDDDGLGIPVRPGDPGSTVREPGVYDAAGFQVERFEPGMFAFAEGADDVKFNTPAANGTNHDAYKRSSLHSISAGFRVPYSLLSGDLTQVNYSSSKVGLEQFHRLVSSVQWQIVIPMLLQPIWEWFVEAAYLGGMIDTDTVEVKWNPPKFPSADPEKDARATIAEVRAGLRSMPEAISATGRDPDEVLAETVAWNKKLDKDGVILDTDPRNTSAQGIAQTEPNPPAGGDPPPTTKKAAGTKSKK
ncbi:phage portal protein [Mesorhizobium sp. M2A.F.Ca.ET.039.01.1.1]|uniref:phage portal protein n=1 Tax=Mesorhizobium sp. M2A.F.Ca.ET.039.01.1.1 TaxID=2496746 RepID=UPI000FCA68D3|nr:phage portal protein [Mesorhizobium sp. M2A.F.Ca.ET.039.01.1.1]RWX72582.1 phage portal protein [Mesorhizobium sp. M2A.F.Ca.ET.039.01.1.1]